MGLVVHSTRGVPSVHVLFNRCGVKVGTRDKQQATAMRPNAQNISHTRTERVRDARERPRGDRILEKNTVKKIENQLYNRVHKCNKKIFSVHQYMI